MSSKRADSFAGRPLIPNTRIVAARSGYAAARLIVFSSSIFWQREQTWRST